MEKASKALLIIEAVALTPLSLEGIILLSSVMTSFAIGLPAQGSSFIEFLGATIMVCALISGLRIFGWVVTSGPSKGIDISPVWWVFAALGAAIAVLSQLEELLGLPVEPLSFALGAAQLGVFFLFPFGHLIIETIWQRRTYRRQVSVSLSTHDDQGHAS